MYDELKLNPDINAILDQKSPLKTFFITAVLYVKGEVIESVRIASLTTHRRYATGISDVSILTLRMLPSFYRKVMKAPDDLECDIIKVLVDNEGVRYDKQALRYKAIVYEPERNQSMPLSAEHLGGGNLDLAGEEHYHFQIVDVRAESLRTALVQGVLHRATPYDALLSLLGDVASKTRVRGKSPVDTLVIAPPDNKAPIQDLVIPTGIFAHSLIDYLQNETVGVYNADAGCYLQHYKGKMGWYVYPLYDPKLQLGNLPKLVIFQSPLEAYDDVNFTYLEKGVDLSIVASANIANMDTATPKTLDTGNGVQFTSSDAIIDGVHRPSTAGPLVAGQHKSVTHGSRSDGNNYARPDNRRLTINPYVGMSRVLRASAREISVIWNKSNDLIYPGMPVIYKVEENREVVTYHGQVIGTQLTYMRLSRDHLDNFEEKTALHIAIFRG